MRERSSDSELLPETLIFEENLTPHLNLVVLEVQEVRDREVLEDLEDEAEEPENQVEEEDSQIALF